MKHHCDERMRSLNSLTNFDPLNLSMNASTCLNSIFFLYLSSILCLLQDPLLSTLMVSFLPDASSFYIVSSQSFINWFSSEWSFPCSLNDLQTLIEIVFRFVVASFSNTTKLYFFLKKHLSCDRHQNIYCYWLSLTRLTTFSSRRLHVFLPITYSYSLFPDL